MIARTRIITTNDTNPHQNLALEDALLRTHPNDQALLFLWQNKHTVVIGAGQNAWRECHTQLLREEGGTLARRSSGGGAVYHDLGNLNFSFVLPREDYDVARQLSVVLAAVQSLGIDAQPSGRNDLVTADGRKFSGNAFRLLKHAALHHGTLLLNVDMGKLGRYLNVDKKKLQAKGVKSVPSRVVNLSTMITAGIEDLKSAMTAAFQTEYGKAVNGIEDAHLLEIDGLEELNRQYDSWDWNYGASPVGEMNLMHRFDWGGLELSFRIRNGRMENVQVFTDAMDETLHLRLQEALEGAQFEGEALSKRALSLGLVDVAAYLKDAEQ